MAHAHRRPCRQACWQAAPPPIPLDGHCIASCSHTCLLSHNTIESVHKRTFLAAKTNVQPMFKNGM